MYLFIYFLQRSKQCTHPNHCFESSFNIRNEPKKSTLKHFLILVTKMGYLKDVIIAFTNLKIRIFLLRNSPPQIYT